jgi:hypothetical protein
LQNSLIIAGNKKLQTETHEEPKEDQFCNSSDRREIVITEHFYFRVHWIKKKGEEFRRPDQNKWKEENCLERSLPFSQQLTS